MAQQSSSASLPAGSAPLAGEEAAPNTEPLGSIPNGRGGGGSRGRFGASGGSRGGWAHRCIALSCVLMCHVYVLLGG